MLSLEEQENREMQQMGISKEETLLLGYDTGLRAFGKGMKTLNRDVKFRIFKM